MKGSKAARKRDAHDGLGMLPWFSADWLSSDAHAELSLEAQGALRNLFDRAWLSGCCRLPAEDERLRALAGASIEEWDRSATAVRSQLVETSDGGLTHERLLFEWRKSKALRLSRRRGADMTNKARWDSEKGAGPKGSLSDRSATRPATRPAVAASAVPFRASSTEEHPLTPSFEGENVAHANNGDGSNPVLEEILAYASSLGLVMERRRRRKIRDLVRGGMELDALRKIVAAWGRG